MKVNRWVALAAIALLVVGAMGFLSYRVFASANTIQAQQNCGSDVEESQTGENESAEAENADTENCDQQGTEATDANEATEVNGQDQSDETTPASTGITADEAKKIAEQANAGTSTLAVEFDREGGHDIWEVELDNNLDVKVDAHSGEILLTEQRD
jgi:uncharacterized membrane protein YkoI